MSQPRAPVEGRYEGNSLLSSDLPLALGSRMSAIQTQNQVRLLGDFDQGHRHYTSLMITHSSFGGFIPDTVSPGLINFIKESLAPDSLEWLFLQDAHLHKTAVTIDIIFRNVIRRHRRSLKKLLIESEDKLEEEPSNPPSWRKWIFNRELLSFMTSNQMPKLRELGMAVDYRDWHSFLQRLPHATRLRSLYIPHISGHVNGRSDSRDLAHQVLDVVALRPELELCYPWYPVQVF